MCDSLRSSLHKASARGYSGAALGAAAPHEISVWLSRVATLCEIARAIKARRLTQRSAAELLSFDQSKVSRITLGQFRGVGEAKLRELATKPGHDVKIVVGPVRRRAGRMELQFA